MSGKIIGCGYVGLVAILVSASASAAQTYTRDIDYRGGDFAVVQVFEVGACAKKCLDNDACSAWTLHNTKCHLKSSILASLNLSTVISGTRVFPYEPGVNRFGSDITSVALATVDPEMCLNQCRSHPNCKAFTIEFQSNLSSMICSIKSKVSAPVKASSFWVSGILSNF